MNMKHVIKSALCLFSLLFSVIFPGFIFSADEKVRKDRHVAGINGMTYSIAEPDALDEILEKAKKFSKSREFEEYTKSRVLSLVNEKLNVNGFGLQKACNDTIRTYEPRFVLTMDIKDHTGKILYPAGYVFNILDYAFFPFKIIFFDPTDSAEVDRLRKMGLLSHGNILIMTKGNVITTSASLNRKVYPASDYLIKFFNIRSTPTVVYQEGKVFRIMEIAVCKEKTGGK